MTTSMPKKKSTKKAPKKKTTTKKAPKKKTTTKKAPKKKTTTKKATKKKTTTKKATKKKTNSKTLKPKIDPRKTHGKNATFEYHCIPLDGFDNAVVFVSSAKELYSIVKINKRIEDKDAGYQRALSTNRVGAIAQFIDGGGVLPTGIVVSFEHARFKRRDSMLTVDVRPDAGWVIDGQHRLAGSYEAEKDIQVPVVAFVNLPIEEQVRIFVTINKEQKGVPTSLYYDLLPYLDAPSRREQQKQALQRGARDLARTLSTSESSPFFGRIVSTRPPSRGKEISLTNFIRKVAPYLKQPKGVLSAYSPERREKLISSFYRALSMVYTEEFSKERSFFFQTLGFGAMMDVLPSVVHHAIIRKRGVRTSDFYELFSMIGDFNVRQYEGKGTGAGSEAEVARDFVQALDYALDSAGNVPSQIMFDE